MTDYLIREATPDDAEAILAHNEIIINEPQNGIIRGPGENMTLEEEQAFLATNLTSDNSLILIAITPSGEVIGLAGLHGGRRKAVRHNAGMGIAINPEWRDKGVGTALLRHMIEWAKQSQIITRIELDVMCHNARAIHLYEKLGFRLEGKKPAYLFKDGRYIDVYIMGLLLFAYPGQGDSG